MSELYRCQNCGERFRGDKIKKCPICETQVGEKIPEFVPLLDKPILDETSQSPPTNAELVSLLVEAQNRTTHAVRSLAVFFLMNLVWQVIVLLLVFIVAISPQVEICDNTGFGCHREPSGFSYFLIFLALVIAVLGAVLALKDSLAELRKSRLGSTLL